MRWSKEGTSVVLSRSLLYPLRRSLLLSTVKQWEENEEELWKNGQKIERNDCENELNGLRWKRERDRNELIWNRSIVFHSLRKEWKWLNQLERRDGWVMLSLYLLSIHKDNGGRKQKGIEIWGKKVTSYPWGEEGEMERKEEVHSMKVNGSSRKEARKDKRRRRRERRSRRGTESKIVLMSKEKRGTMKNESDGKDLYGSYWYWYVERGEERWKRERRGGGERTRSMNCPSSLRLEGRFWVRDGLNLSLWWSNRLILRRS